MAAEPQTVPSPLKPDAPLILTISKGNGLGFVHLAVAITLLPSALLFYFPLTEYLFHGKPLRDLLQGWLLALVFLVFAKITSLLRRESWRLDAHGVSRIPPWGKAAFIAWADVERVEVRYGVVLHSSSASLVIPSHVGRPQQDAILHRLEACLGSRFDFSGVNRPAPPVIRHPVFFTVYSLSALLWYLVVIPFTSARVNFFAAPPSLILAFIFAPALPLIPFIILIARRESRDRYLPRKP